MNESNQQMIEVLKSGQVIAVVPKANEDYYRDVEFRGHPDERKISYRPYKTPEERAAQAEVLIKKVDFKKEIANDVNKLVELHKQGISNNSENPITNVTELNPEKPKTPKPKK